ncbi:Pterin-4-alpha-carbinolamine dehydratase 2 [Hirschfeldia incana]|nr:Pterin-4-alpha-carbinolamine dehydratase 2 [Hirschfeldia incana]
MSRLLLPTLFSVSRKQVLPAAHNLYGHHRSFVHWTSAAAMSQNSSATGGSASSGARTFCSLEDLSAKKCVPCNAKDLRPMTEQSAQELLQKVAGWDMANDNGTLKLQQSWKAKSFTKGLDFFKRVADIAESEGHHPDLHLVGWNNVKIDIWTHAIGGLTENDFILAAKINELQVEDLLRKKKVAK